MRFFFQLQRYQLQKVTNVLTLFEITASTSCQFKKYPAKPFLIHARAQGFVASLAEGLCLTAAVYQERPSLQH